MGFTVRIQGLGVSLGVGSPRVFFGVLRDVPKGESRIPIMQNTKIQRLQYPLFKEYTLNYIRDPTIF